MAVKGAIVNKHTKIHKRTKQGGQKKTASMNKSEKRSYKKYRGQGR
jgi:hypothetical protein